MIDLRVHLLGRKQREARAEIEAHLIAEHRQRAGAGAVALAMTVVAHVAHEIEVGLHWSQGVAAAIGDIVARRRNAIRRDRGA